MQAPELLRLVAEALERANVPYMVTGSYASALHGEPRATRDIDVVIDPAPGSIDMVVAAFPPGRFASAMSSRRSVDGTGSTSSTRTPAGRSTSSCARIALSAGRSYSGANPRSSPAFRPT